ncbi:ATP-grasp domain-containing protein [Hoyosella altamirensis]|uniref:ATP-grasp domain-containing protein n=1 Tax=Hoyosella altamirensis TaxID=616997 RepID=A0A839RKE8_9ACTN|nr:hypothetical protein [Hoyosella altamirensis]MBB3036698.1 hypothetical protein [Hoyosella altamirensis]
MTTPAMPLLLRAKRPVTELHPHSRDFQARVGHPQRQSSHAGHPPACVLTLTRTADQEIDALSLQLAAQGIPLVRIDADRCTQAETLWDPVTGTLHWEGNTFRPVVCWRRYFDAQAMRLQGTGRHSAGRLETHYMRDQWSAWGHAMAASVVRRINHSAGSSPPDRISQLRAARSAGLRIPATAVTSVPASALKAIAGEGDLLVKSLGHHAVESAPGQLHGVYPERLRRDAIRTYTSPELAPVLVQEFVEADRELRVYIIGAQMVAYAVTRPAPEALWTTPDSIFVEECTIPAAIEVALWRVANQFGLEMAAFDLLDAPGGPVFLEVNTHSDWLWAERKAKSDAVSRAVHTMVKDLFEAHDTAPEGSTTHA